MARISIRNRAEPEWKTAIEAKLPIMLGSMLAHMSRLEVDLDREPKTERGRGTYRCRILAVESNGQKYLHFSEQPDGNLAIEGAIARVRRAITRLGRSRTGGQGVRVSAEVIGFSRFR